MGKSKIMAKRKLTTCGEVGHTMILRLALELPEDLSFVRITRTLGRSLLEHLQADPTDINDIELLVGELCTNVLRHAQSNQRLFHVILDYHSDFVGITVQDRGPGFSFQDVPIAGTERADLDGGQRIGGFGLGLIESLTDRLEFSRTDPQGTTVYAEKKLHYQNQEAARAADKLDRSESEATITTI